MTLSVLLGATCNKAPVEDPPVLGHTTYKYVEGAGSECSQMAAAETVRRELLDERLFITAPSWIRPATAVESPTEQPWAIDTRLMMGLIDAPLAGVWAQELFVEDTPDGLDASLEKRLAGEPGEITREDLGQGWTAHVARWRYEDGVLQGVMAYVVDPEGAVLELNVLSNDPVDRAACGDVLERIWTSVEPGPRRNARTVELLGTDYDLPEGWVVYPSGVEGTWRFIEPTGWAEVSTRGEAELHASPGPIWELPWEGSVEMLGREFRTVSQDGERIAMAGCSEGEPNLCFQVWAPDPQVFVEALCSGC